MVYPFLTVLYCKCLNARFECNAIIFFVYSHYPFNQNAKSSDTKCFYIRIKRVMKITMSLHSEIYSVQYTMTLLKGTKDPVLPTLA